MLRSILVNLNFIKPFFKLTIVLVFLTRCNTSTSSNTFFIANKHKVSNIYINQNIEPLVLWAINDFADDIEEITGKRPEIIQTKTTVNGKGIYIGKFSDAHLKSLNNSTINNLNNKWEEFYINISEEKLIIAGSDIRGTVYGIFDLAEQLGISPWKWWSDVNISKKRELSINIKKKGINEHPSVKYRGIFLNDEDWGLQPWAAKTLEPETGDIGPKTYEKIFQLLLRLKANTLWPAMHPSTKAFFSIEGNKEMAEKYHIFVGTSHAEPMLRNNVDEWKKDIHGQFNYFTNSEKVKEYWQERITEVKNGNNIYTLGMRGVHDSGMQGTATKDEKTRLVETIFTEQQKILTNTIEKPIEDIPQVFTIYKEVLDIYNNGLKVPEDVTLMWTDDNYGYIRKLSNTTEQQRKGGSGVYYHLSYWGRPHDYLWLSTTQPALIWYEMSKAYHNGAQKIWIANVGDIKPTEYNMEFFLDLAWNINTVNNNDINHHMIKWAEREFGSSISKEVANLMNEYYRLAFIRKPEFMGWSQVEPKTKTKESEFNIWANHGNEVDRRIKMYQTLSLKVDKLKDKIPENRLDAWFQLVEYPVKTSNLVNRKFLFYELAQRSSDSIKRKEYLLKSKNSFDSIKKLTSYYNKKMNFGKWNHMMSMNPRNLNVFDYPSYSSTKVNTNKKIKAKNEQQIFIQVNEHKVNKAYKGYKWEEIKGLGYGNCATTLFPLKTQHFEKNKWPFVEFEFEANQIGEFELQIKLLPTHSNNFDDVIGIQIDTEKMTEHAINTKGRSKKWKKNILRNSQVVKIKQTIMETGKHTIKIYVNQTGIVIDQLAIDFAMDEPFYEIPFSNSELD